MRGKIFKFTFKDFCEITNLPAYTTRPRFVKKKEKGSVADIFYKGKKRVTYQDLKETMVALNPKRRIEPLAFLKFVSLFVIDGVLLTKDHGTMINADHFDWVEDFENFKKYPWALESYKLMVSNMKSLMRGQPEKFEASLAKKPDYKNAKFTVWSLPHVLQVWAYEKIPGLAGKCGQKVKSEKASMLNWKAVGFFHYSSLKELVFTDEPLEESDDDNDGEEDGEEESDEEDDIQEDDGDDDDGAVDVDVKLFKKLKVMEELAHVRNDMDKLRTSVTVVQSTLHEVKGMLCKLMDVVGHGKQEAATEEKEVTNEEKDKHDSVHYTQCREHDILDEATEKKSEEADEVQCGEPNFPHEFIDDNEGTEHGTPVVAEEDNEGSEHGTPDVVTADKHDSDEDQQGSEALMALVVTGEKEKDVEVVDRSVPKLPKSTLISFLLEELKDVDMVLGDCESPLPK
ncbi:unnamed protein product [Cuscuta epithymum]|uniref:DUF1985 domain-containing protein n=1 Tax=Cuscuta epithymum TaxID=186058 RepID=A0AAV0DBH4_9ASTE|nr:unnamed protein product [Cuscuta epithymum]